MQTKDVGGIDLTANQLPLTVREQNGAVNLVMDEQLIKEIESAKGLTPDIISIKPNNDIANFLGVTVAPSI